MISASSPLAAEAHIAPRRGAGEGGACRHKPHGKTQNQPLLCSEHMRVSPAGMGVGADAPRR